MKTQDLFTTAGESLKRTPWEAYPRPQLRRQEWLCLNGQWGLRVSDKSEKMNSGTDREMTKSGSGSSMPILVPFCPESLLSGYQGNIGYGVPLRYSRSFRVPEHWTGKRIILHFGAVGNRCEVYVNRKKAGEHANGYLPFEIDITEALTAEEDGENLLEVDVINDLSGILPTGKQRIKRGGMWYTPVSGIWQTVWLEPVAKEHITGLRIDTDMAGADIQVSGINDGTVICEGKEYSLRNGKVRIEPEDIRLWSPETPNLYHFTIKSAEDSAESYFALRSLTIKEYNGIKRLCLNDKPYFFNGLLDQGYYSDGLYTPAVPEEYERDIRAMKELGFNTLRKHIKIEPEQFYYDCDRLGMAVFQDMVNNGGYSFFRDTLLPTIGLMGRKDRRLHKDKAARNEFLNAMDQTVELLRNHPCICYWTIFNEGWGQFEADEAYERLKALDGSRFIDATSGWFHQSKSDVDSSHIYFKKLRLGARRELPQVLSEFGGYVYKEEKHSYNLEKTYGYRILSDREDYKEAVRKLYKDELLPLVKEGLCAAIYTQVSDVEDETNGLLTFDRKVCKIKPDEIKDIMGMLNEEMG